MRTRQSGFTLIELMVVVVIVGILAALAIPNFVQMQNRAKEGGLKANMHTFQLASEDYSVLSGGTYAAQADDLVPLVPGGTTTFRNPFSRMVGSGAAWEDRASYVGPSSATVGITSYADSVSMYYNIKGYGSSSMLTMVLGVVQ